MTKSELILRLTQKHRHLYQRDIERIVNTVFNSISTAMIHKDRVELRGFGTFSVRERDSRIGRNPRTGAAVAVEEKVVPFFKMGKLLLERLNSKQG